MHKEPTLESFIDFSPENTFIDPFEGRQFEKKLKHEDKIERKERLKKRTRRQKAKDRLANIAIVLIPLIAADVADISLNYEYATHAEVSLSYVAPPLDPKNNDTALFVFNGFNSTSAEPIVSTIGPAAQQAIDGRIVSINYNNAQLGSYTYPGKTAQMGIDNINAMADQARDYSTKNGIKYAVFVDYSLGCVPGTMVGENLTQNPKKSPLVKAFINISCPPNFDSLQNKTQGEVDFVKAVSFLPGAAYSTGVRDAGEVYFLNQEYEHGNPWEGIANAGTLIPNAITNVNNKNATGTWTIFDEAMLSDQGNFDTRFRTIANNTSDSLTPLILDVRTGPTADDPTHQDEVVNDSVAGPDMIIDAQKAPLPHMSLVVPGAIHGEPEQSSKEFKQTFAAAKIAIQQSLSLQEKIYNVKQIQDLSRQPILHVQK